MQIVGVISGDLRLDVCPSPCGVIRLMSEKGFLRARVLPFDVKLV